MAWAETTPGCWQRPIGENESMIKMIGDTGREFGRDVWSISVTASFTARLRQGERARPLPQVLQEGWKILRFCHPSIAAIALDEDETMVYSVPGPQQLEQWAKESFVVVDDDIDPDALISRLTHTRFTTLYYLQVRSSLVVHFSHWRTDGIGAFHLLNAYFRAVMESSQQNYLELPWGQEPARLTPSVEKALKLPSIPSPTIEDAAKRYLSTLVHSIGACSTPYKPGHAVVSGGTQSTGLLFSQEETAELEATCRRLGLRLEAAVHASVTSTAYDIADPASRQRHHTTTLRHSLRPHLPAPYDSEAGAAGLYTAGYFVKADPSHSWAENAARYEAEYRQGATLDLLSSRRQYAALMKAILKSRPLPDPPPSGLDISCIPNAQGLVQKMHSSEDGSLEVHRIAIGVDVLSRHLYVFIWVFDDRLEFRLVYNDAFYDEALTKRILGLMKTHLVENLHPSFPGPQTDLVS